ncbi:MAG: chemotaxis protein CheW [Methylococcaceae bacterium]|jgi:purine-binding chemotaxis protein CheW|nr:chemotaxis protein CheW [Methylococcaceae bacterium]MDZ4155935.1 chemotaxis protein CheW [Methylococcales bacterium]MDP2392741.1 chemotaxis protein CheW [Methylococcaceae bacterium]MDP3019911.1 chemotaxis protein CheW [Methylococcaceae bacterium]MDP3389906.1 chemotaxis protein CheW [Methylococcaceae bacterium]
MNQLIHKKQHNELAAQEQLHQYLTFLVGKDNLAISILDVKEIIEINAITEVPMTPDHIRGVINLRGHVVPVIDLSARLGRGCSEITKRTCIVLVQVEYNDETQLLGMLVDAVDEILDLPETSILPPPDFGADIRNDFIQAMGRVGDEFIILLNINRVLSVKELSQLKKIADYDSNHERIESII